MPHNTSRCNVINNDIQHHNNERSCAHKGSEKTQNIWKRRGIFQQLVSLIVSVIILAILFSNNIG